MTQRSPHRPAPPRPCFQNERPRLASLLSPSGGAHIVRLGHISDLHVADRSRYPRSGFTAKDCDRHSAKLARGLLEALLEVGVDHLVVTGDLTLSGEAREFERASELLRPRSPRRTS